MTQIISILFYSLQKERDRLVLWLPVLFAVGIGGYFSFDAEPDLEEVGIVSIGFLLALMLFWRNGWARIVFAMLFTVAAGVFWAGLRTEIMAAPVLADTIFYREVRGQISDIQSKENGEKIYLTDVVIEGLEAWDTPRNISVSLRKMPEKLSVGDKVLLYATLFPPPTPVMPRAYDFARMFYFQQLGAVGYAPNPPSIVAEVDPEGFEPRLNALRLSLTQRIREPMQLDNGWVAAAMMVGEMSGISKAVADSMRDSGIYHVVSISGLHMSLAAMLMFYTVRFLLCLYPAFALHMPIKKIAAFVALLAAFAYLLLAGYPVPAVRSFVMVACVMVAILFERTGISIFSLAWAGMITLIWQPEALLGASFQLSFAATIAILAFYERYSDVLYKERKNLFNKIWIYFLSILCTSLVATIATAPLIINHFNRFTIWGVVANMLLLPLVSCWIMPFAVVALLAMPFGLEYFPLLALDKGIGLMLAGSHYIASLPYATVSLPSLSSLGLLAVVFAGLWLAIWQGKKRFVAVPFMMLGVSTIALHSPYDVLISSDASKVALRKENGNMVFLRGKADSFDGDVWLRANGLENAEDSAEDMCDAHQCIVQMDGKKIVVTKGKKKIDMSCDGKPDIVISQNYLDKESMCANVPIVIDSEYLEYFGATALRFDRDAVKIESSRDYRGERPWVQ